MASQVLIAVAVCSLCSLASVHSQEPFDSVLDVATVLDDVGELDLSTPALLTTAGKLIFIVRHGMREMKDIRSRDLCLFPLFFITVI